MHVRTHGIMPLINKPAETTTTLGCAPGAPGHNGHRRCRCDARAYAHLICGRRSEFARQRARALPRDHATVRVLTLDAAIMLSVGERRTACTPPKTPPRSNPRRNQRRNALCIPPSVVLGCVVRNIRNNV